VGAGSWTTPRSASPATAAATSPAAAINNGVIVTLNSHATWTVTGTSYLTKLSLDSTSRVVAAPGKNVSLTVNGASTNITPGQSYTGTIVLTVK
jgi:hypothetical protein